LLKIKKYRFSYLIKISFICAFLQIFFIQIYLFADIPQHQDKIYDSLKIELDVQKISSLKVPILNELAWHLAPSAMDESITYADSAIKLAKNFNLKEAEASALNNKGEALRNKGLFKEALEAHESAFKIFTVLNDPVNMAKTESNIGIAYFSLSDFSSAFKHFDNSLDMYRLLKDQDGILNSNSYIGVVLSSFGQHEKAIEYFEKALKIAIALGKDSKIATQYNNLGLSHADLKQFPKSIDYYKLAVNIFKNNNDDFNYAIALGNLGIPQSEMGLYAEAISNFRESLKISRKIGDNYGVAHQYGNLGEIYLKMAQDTVFNSDANDNTEYISLAIKNLKLAVEEFKSLGAIEDEKDYLSILSDAYSKAHKYKMAYSAIKEAAALKDSIQSLENQKVIAELEIKQELDNKKNEIKILNQDREYQAVVKTAVSILAVLILFIAGLIFFFFKKKQKDNILLQKNIERREEVENSLRLNEAELTKHKNHLEKLVRDRTKKLENEILEHKETEEALLMAIERAEIANNAKSIFLANMSHELRTPLVGILGYSDLLSNIVEDEDAKEMAQGINRTGNRLLSTLSLVLDLARIESDKFEIDLAEVNIIDLIKETHLNFRAMANNKNLALVLDLHTDCFNLSTDVGMIKVILENLINNAIKFTKEGQITIKSKICDTNDTPNFCLQVSDTGVGIKKQDIPKIFEEFKQLSEGFTKDFQGSGLGLSITKKFVNLLGGIIEVESEPGKGSTFSIKFPIEIKAVA
jgi:signal transduction histidine kinase